MQEEFSDRSWMDVVLPVGILVVLVALGWAGLRFMDKPGTSPSAADVIEAIEHPATLPVGSARIAAPGAVVAQSVNVVTVYQCEEDGQQVMSDRPCEPGADAHAQ